MIKKLLIINLIFILSIISCSKKQDKITITYVKAPLNVPSIIERNKGIFSNSFKKHNISVEYSTLTTGPEQTQALASGDIQFLYAVGATSIILAKANGLDIKILNTYSRAPEAYILFSKDKGFTSSQEVRGKKVAGPKGTILHELLIAYLNTLGLKENDIEFISMGIPEAQSALASGAVDMALIAGPSAYNMSKEGYNIVTTAKGLIEPVIVVATSEKFYLNNKEIVKEFINAQREVLEYINSNYDEAMKISAEETGLNIEAVEEMYRLYDFSLDITYKDIESMKKTELFMLENKMIESSVDIEELIIK